MYIYYLHSSNTIIFIYILYAIKETYNCNPLQEKKAWLKKLLRFIIKIELTQKKLKNFNFFKFINKKILVKF